MTDNKDTDAITEVKAESIGLKEITVETSPLEGPVKSLYSNSASFVTTPFDVRLVFGQIRPGPSGKLVNEQRISVVMSWEHTKALLNALQKTVEDHEMDFGPIHYKKRSET